MLAFFKRRSKENFWALLDQGTVSLGNFLTQILLARALPAPEYGIFALLFGLLLLLHSLHSSLVTYPLSVKGAAEDHQGLRRHAGASMFLTAMLLLPFAAVLWAGAAILGRPRVLPWLIIGCFCWQLQETTRRSLMAHLRHRSAMWGDTVGYLGQAAAIAALWKAGWLTLETAFLALAATSATAALIQGLQLRLRLSTVRFDRAHARSYWDLGQWALWSNALSILTIQAFPWTLAFFHGPAAAAELQTLVNVVGVSHPLLFSLSNLIVPSAAQFRANGVVREAIQASFGYAFQGGLILLPYFGVLLLWPEMALRTFYGHGSPYLSLTSALRVFVLAYVFLYLGHVASALLCGLEQSRSAFYAQLSAAAVAAAVGLPLAARGGVLWGAAGIALANTVRAACSAWFMWRVGA